MGEAAPPAACGMSESTAPQAAGSTDAKLVDKALELLQASYGPGGWVFGYDGQRWWALRKGAAGSLLEAPGPVELALLIDSAMKAGQAGAQP